MKHPYLEHERTPLWRSFDSEIAALETNGDLELTTSRPYILGAFSRRLVRDGAVPARLGTTAAARDGESVTGFQCAFCGLASKVNRWFSPWMSSCSAAAADVQRELADIRRSIEARLQSRIVQAIESGEMGSETDVDALAGHIMAVIQGMSTLARDGASREKLMRVAATALRSWPGSPTSPQPHEDARAATIVR